MARRKKTSILVIDDDHDICWLLEKLLSSEGYRVITASSGEEAIEVIKKEMIHAMLLDIVLPGMNGLEAYRLIKKIKPHIPVIIITGYATENIKMESKKLGVAGFVSKPFKNEELLNLIRKTLT